MLDIDLFVRTYLLDRDIANASKAINIKESQGRALLTLPEVKDKMTALQSTPDYIISNLKRIADTAMSTQPLPHSQTDEVPEGYYDYDPAMALKALELLGKNKKLFTDKVEALNINTPFEDYIKRVEDDEEY